MTVLIGYLDFDGLLEASEDRLILTLQEMRTSPCTLYQSVLKYLKPSNKANHNFYFPSLASKTVSSYSLTQFMVRLVDATGGNINYVERNL